MVDTPNLDAIRGSLRSYLQVLRGLAEIPRDEFLTDADKIGSAKYNFVVAIECCINIANHIIASERLRMPRDTADSFVVLVEAGICPTELDGPLQSLTVFQDRLLYRYWDVDDLLVAEYLSTCLGDFDRFAAAIGAAV